MKAHKYTYQLTKRAHVIQQLIHVFMEALYIYSDTYMFTPIKPAPAPLSHNYSMKFVFTLMSSSLSPPWHHCPSSVPSMLYFNPPTITFSLSPSLSLHYILFFSLPAFRLFLSRCTTCTVRGTWNSADYHATSCFAVWSHGPCILWLLKLAP